ncbi:unnamed protein product [Oppiella nova]|uniref:Uncharacterized protein n=1 Tax=Oppiella nova TaxID=334625 RepID=A0A7R9M8N6_9ACAR|nr:unnamed protein product [Oppiella nova]CAG2172264.1 unnamed protein product [Oppiella nova]
MKYFYVFSDDFWRDHNILFVTFDDMVYGLGPNSSGQLGLGHKRPINTPQRVPELSHKNIHQFFNGFDFVLAVNTDNNVIFSFGGNNDGQLGWHVDKECNWCTSLAITYEGQVLIWGEVETDDKLNNSISYKKSFDEIDKLGEGGFGLD